MAHLIFLIGMPAAGKTYWGQQLSVALGLPFIDLDKYIEEQEQAGIPELFEDDGEASFREKETTYLSQIIATAAGDTIIACGGGTPCFNNNLQVMKNAGSVIYLQASVGQLVANLTKDDETRPLLRAKTDLPGFLQQLLDRRWPYYEQAHIILASDNISLPTFAEIVSSCINKP